MKTKLLIYVISYIISLSFILVGSLFKLQHYQGGFAGLTIASVFTVIYVVIGLREIYDSRKPTHWQKVTWTFYFILVPFIAGVTYLIRRKEFVNL